jgi:hypothetical protein
MKISNREIHEIRERDFFFRVFRVVRGSIRDGQSATAGAISGA